MKTTKHKLLLLTLITAFSCVQDDPCNQKNEDGTNITLTSEQKAKCDADDQNGSDEPDDPVVVDPDPDDPQDPVDPADPDLFDLSSYIADTVDRAQNRDELAKPRSLSSDFKVDRCHAELNGMNQFSDSIAFFVGELSKGQQVQLQSLGSIFGYSTNPSTYEKVSLLSHPLCDVTRSSLSHTIAGRSMPDTTTINLAQRFADDHNRYRTQFLNGDEEGSVQAQRLWGRFFGCLAYTESLTTADTSSSRSVASRIAPRSYTKPAGVKFYIDPRQSEASKLNIGLFQFTPTFGGNINPCIKQWNKDYPSCQISDRSTDNMIYAVGSAAQHFNAYCGVHKLLQTFFVQTHSNQTRRTHPANFPSGRMKPTSQRCVTPHIHASRAYNHFGPLQNTTGNNLKKLMSCVYK